MRFRIVCIWLTFICAFSIATGCQTSKFNMQKLAFWKNNDQLDSEYLEPPSHQFTPERTAVADSVSRLDKGDGPPKRPETASNDTSLEDFEKELNRSREELASKTKASAKQFESDINRAKVDTANISMPPTSQSRDDLKQPLMPRYVSSGNSSSFEKNSTSTEPNPGNFSPLAPKPTSTPSTRYEQIAQASPPSLSPMQPSLSNTSGSGDFIPPGGSMPKITEPRTPVALQTQPTMPQVSGSGSEPSRMQNPYTPGLQPMDTQAKPVAGQFQTNNNAMATNANPTDGYESTPYAPFVSRNETTPQNNMNSNVMQAGNSSSDGRSTQVAQIPATLQLSGQGTYAPGSVRRPAPLQPESLTATPQTGGGSFMR